MTLPASGPLSLNNIANEFGGYVYPSNYSAAGRNINFSNYLNNGGYIPNDGTIHSSGQISVSMFYDKCDYSTTTKGLWYGGGTGTGTYYSIRTTVDENGTVSSDSTLTNAQRTGAGAVYYGGGPALLWGGFVPPSTNYSTVFTRVNSSGVFSADENMTTGRRGVQGLTYGFDKGLFYGGYNFSVANATGMSGNFFGSTTVSSSGVIGTDTFIVGTYTSQGFYTHTALSYGGSNDKGIFAFGGNNGGRFRSFQLVSNTGVIGSLTEIVSTAGEGNSSGAGYGGDKGYIFRDGTTETRNQLSNTGVIASDSNISPTTARFRAGFVYGGSKGIMGYGQDLSTFNAVATVQYITNVGVVGAATATATSVRIGSAWVAATAYGA